ncbi:MAG TPA: cell division protein [Dongiaceae bacterium]|jgi:cell division transport system permease protein|nr:cell division protein [Dongiaceae bacterium]
MLRFRTDLPLDRDTTAHFLPWIIGFMVYLAIIAATVALVVDHVTSRWQRDLSGQLTVELPAVTGEDGAARKQRVAAAVDEISDTNGVVGTRLLDAAEVKRLLSPWLGDAAGQLGVTLPDLVAVSLQPGLRPNLSELAERLQAASPGAVIDDHADFNERAMNFLKTIEVLAVSLLALVLAATAVVVAFTARAGLSIHRRIVEIVHLVGAHDSYVARQFQAQAFRYGFLGAMIGTLLAILTLIAAGIFAVRGAAPMGAAIRAFEPWMIWPLALIPLAAVLIAMITVRLAVLHSLRRMAY